MTSRIRSGSPVARFGSAGGHGRNSTSASTSSISADGVADRVDRSRVDQWGRSERSRQLARRAFAPIHDRWFRVEWEGLEHVPRHGAALLVANHAGVLPPDGAVVTHGIETQVGRPVYTLAHRAFWQNPLVGTVASRLGAVEASRDNAYRLLHDHEALVLDFPEGARGAGKHIKNRYRLEPFGHGGFAETAMRSGAPIVPIAIVGAEETMPVVARFPNLARRLRVPNVALTLNTIIFGPPGLVTWLPAKFHVRVLQPVHIHDKPGAGQGHHEVRAAADDIRSQIDHAIRDMLRKRTSVWR
jgi:1-acyl-sn-glycerol-3-phosphate acyltransferase